MTLSFDLMAPMMFGGLIVFLLLGYPVAFSLSAVGLGFGFLSIKLGYFDFVLLQALPERIYGILSNQLLLSIPFFTFMGAILERCGLAEDLLDTMGQLFGPIRGGLAYSVILVGALLGAITGTVAASVIAMGLISLPVMQRYGYDPRVSTGVIAASGTITQIIPPSLVLVVLADAMGKSVGDMYAGAFIPGIALAGLYAVFTIGVSVFKPAWAPALPPEARRLKEPDGSSGTISFVVIAVAATVASVLFDKYYYVPKYADAALDERLVVSAAAGAAFALLKIGRAHV
jgi:tripartite ATP-independent transporter DctM subunit